VSVIQAMVAAIAKQKRNAKFRNNGNATDRPVMPSQGCDACNVFFFAMTNRLGYYHRGTSQ